MMIRIKSHRARQNMENALGYMPIGYFSFYFEGEFREIPDEQFEKLKGIKGISRARVDESQLRTYWN